MVSPAMRHPAMRHPAMRHPAPPLLGSLLLLLLAASADGARIKGSADIFAGPRLAVELTHTITLEPSAGEPPMGPSSVAHCVLLGTGGFAIGLPTAQPINSSHNDAGKGWVLRKNLMNGLLILPATVKDNQLQCEVPQFGSAGNTSVCAVLGPVDPWAAAPPPLTCNPGADNSTYAPAFFQRFALFSPQFSRRPYIREQNGSVVVLTDRSLRGQTLQLTASLGNGSAQISATIRGGSNVSVPFSLAGLPPAVEEDVELSLTVVAQPGGRKQTATHTRRFVRAAPPAKGSGIVTWQVDHTTKGLLVDGAPFIAAGWFGSGGLHESVGLPAGAIAKAAAAAKTLTLDELQMLSQAGVTTEWARQGHTFVKAGLPPRAGDEDYEKESVRLSLEYMDAAAAAGVYVPTPFNIGINTCQIQKLSGRPIRSADLNVETARAGTRRYVGGRPGVSDGRPGEEKRRRTGRDHASERERFPAVAAWERFALQKPPRARRLLRLR